VIDWVAEQRIFIISLHPEW